MRDDLGPIEDRVRRELAAWGNDIDRGVPEGPAARGPHASVGRPRVLAIAAGVLVVALVGGGVVAVAAGGDGPGDEVVAGDDSSATSAPVDDDGAVEPVEACAPPPADQPASDPASSAFALDAAAPVDGRIAVEVTADLLRLPGPDWGISWDDHAVVQQWTGSEWIDAYAVTGIFTGDPAWAPLGENAVDPDRTSIHEGTIVLADDGRAGAFRLALDAVASAALEPDQQVRTTLHAYWTVPCDPVTEPGPGETITSSDGVAPNGTGETTGPTSVTEESTVTEEPVVTEETVDPACPWVVDEAARFASVEVGGHTVTFSWEAQVVPDGPTYTDDGVLDVVATIVVDGRSNSGFTGYERSDLAAQGMFWWGAALGDWDDVDVAVFATERAPVPTGTTDLAFPLVTSPVIPELGGRLIVGPAGTIAIDTIVAEGPQACDG
jgi:hypothetical protein